MSGGMAAVIGGITAQNYYRSEELKRQKCSSVDFNIPTLYQKFISLDSKESVVFPEDMKEYLESIKVAHNIIKYKGTLFKAGNIYYE